MENLQKIDKITLKRIKHDKKKNKLIDKLLRRQGSKPKFIISKIFQRKLRTCIQCRIKRHVQYSMKEDLINNYICTENCLDCFKMEKQNYQISYIPKIQVSSFPELKHLFTRSCKVCNTSDRLSLTWQGMDFCNELCLLEHQMDVGSACLQCTEPVTTAALGQHCMRFGGDIRQFCSERCLDIQKKSFEMCSYCMQNTQLKPLQLTGAVVKFCSPKCQISYWNIKNGPFLRNEGQVECRVCQEVGELCIKYDSPGFPSTYFCTERCFEDFCQTYNVDAAKCCLCSSFTPTQYLRKYTVFQKNLLYVFCSAVCKKLFLIEDIGVIECVGCKSDKLSRDAVKKHENLNVVEACSLYCLGLYQAELCSTEVRCAYCHKPKRQMFSITVLDNTLRRFCSLACLEGYAQNGDNIETIVVESDNSTENINQDGNSPDEESNSVSVSEYYIALPSRQAEQHDRATMIKLKKFRPEASCKVSTEVSHSSQPPVIETTVPLEHDSMAKDEVQISFGMDLWLSWRRQKGPKSTKTLTSDILILNDWKLDNCLSRFVREVKRPDGGAYPPDTLYYICLGIQKYFLENGRDDNIFNYRQYKNFNKSLNDVVFKLSIANTLPLLKVDENHLWDSKQLGDYSPEVLTHTLIYFFAKYCKLMTVRSHLGLSLKQIAEEFCAFQGSIPRSITVKLCVVDAMFANDVQFILERNDDIPIRCPIRLCRFYLSKCPGDMKKYQQVFYLKPARTYFNLSRWFSSSPLTGDVIQKHLNLIMLVKGIVE